MVLTAFDPVVEDVREERRVMKSDLADTYPCSECGGDGFVEIQVDVDEVYETDCDQCHGTGADEFAEGARQVDGYLADSKMTVSTRAEVELRDCLIRALAGSETLDDYSSSAGFESPVIAKANSGEVRQLVELLEATAKDKAAQCEPDGRWPYSFGVLIAMVEKLLHTAVVSGKSIHEVIHEALGSASKATAGDGGAAV